MDKQDVTLNKLQTQVEKLGDQVVKLTTDVAVVHNQLQNNKADADEKHIETKKLLSDISHQILTFVTRSDFHEVIGTIKETHKLETIELKEFISNRFSDQDNRIKALEDYNFTNKSGVDFSKLLSDKAALIIISAMIGAAILYAAEKLGGAL